MHLIRALKKYSNPGKTILFTTPGHSQGRAVFGEIKDLIGINAFKADLSEIYGLDNAHSPTSTILRSQMRASEAYGSKFSYYLYNGSTSGIIALMLTVARPGEKVLIARNAHKSVINALVLSGAMPVWLNTEWIEDWNIPGTVDNEKVRESLDKSPDIKAVWLTNPTYEGIVTDIFPIAQLCKEREIPLIVDEAHGALWNFNDKLPIPAIKLGADASVQSLHKTGSSLTQGSILHLGPNSRISPDELQKNLNIINTTSPSYLILASIEGAIEHLRSQEGLSKLDELLKNVEKFRKNLVKNSAISLLGEADYHHIDITKMFLRIKGTSGYDLSKALFDKYNIEVELDNDTGILALTGIGTSKKNLDKLANSVVKIANSLEKQDNKSNNFASIIEPKVVFTPREAFYKKSKNIRLKDSLGLISKETIVSYPPGIPTIIAGEKIQEAHIDLLKDLSEISIILD